MLQATKAHHFKKKDGTVTGGTSYGIGICVAWQNGALKTAQGEEREPNGAFVGDVIAVAMDRLKRYQASPHKCDENEMAIEALSEALGHLQDRQIRRVELGTAGTHTPDVKVAAQVPDELKNL